MTSIAFLERISKISLILLVFLLPLWFLPFSQNILDYQKQALLMLLVFVGVAAALATVINRGEIRIHKSILSPLALSLLLSVGLSTLFSLWKYGSFWGWPLHTTDNFVTFLGFVLLYFLILFHTERIKNLVPIYFLLIVSGALAGIYGVLQLYGVFLVPFALAKQIGFNTIGTANNLAVFGAALLPLSFVLTSLSKSFLRWIIWILVFILLGVLAVINSFEAWIVLVVGLLVLLAFGLGNMKKRTEFGWVSFPMALLAVAIFFLIFKVALPGTPQSPVEVRPSQSAEMSIAGQVLRERPFLGSGPGTFVFDYTKHHSSVLNQSIFWGTRFASGASEVLDWVITKGILGILALALLIGAALFFCVKSLAQSSAQEEHISWMIGLGTLASFIALASSLFLHPATFSAWFLFWVLLAGVSIFIAREIRTISVAPPSFLALISSFVFLLMLIFGLGLIFLGGQKYAAEAYYLKALRLSQEGNLDQSIAKVTSAIKLNPSSDLYWRDLAQLYLSRLQTLSQDTSMSAEERQQKVQAAVNDAIVSARQATALSPMNVANWNVQGFVYRNLIGIQGASELAVQAYQKAVEFDPSSPFSFTELGRVYLLEGQRLKTQQGSEQQRTEALEKSLEQLQKAVSLKADYSPAHFLIAAVYAEQGKSEEAVRKLEELKAQNPQDVGLAFQLGLVYYQKENFGKAQQEFERAKKLNGNYANAIYMLGLTYDKQGEREKAKGEFQKVLALNPNNEEVKRILANLEAKKPALQGLTPAQPPVGEETPPEIK